ncbi:hypothetical protein PVL29_004847 [Vitis rotundifolia]|uniref:Uncharacterized protein n=1 Tax=Vitis rotundifolia TaxID=103349 RepID=A0AA39E052_VITRO|nr:hypothetical protein PVL29_004847 [Vitis rotundifolia]
MVKIFLQWSQSMKIVISGRGKFEYLTGETKAPVVTDPAYKIWFAENSIPRMYGILPNECTRILAMCHRCLKFDQN